jgi:hypothetical protein
MYCWNAVRLGAVNATSGYATRAYVLPSRFDDRGFILANMRDITVGQGSSVA